MKPTAALLSLALTMSFLAYHSLAALRKPIPVAGSAPRRSGRASATSGSLIANTGDDLCDRAS